MVTGIRDDKVTGVVVEGRDPRSSEGVGRGDGNVAMLAFFTRIVREQARRDAVVRRYARAVARDRKAGKPGPGMHAEQFAKRLGMSRRTVQRWAAASEAFPARWAEAWARAMRVAEQRRRLVVAWRRACRRARRRGETIAEATDTFTRRRGVSRSQLYGFWQSFAEYGISGLLDGRTLAVIHAGYPKAATTKRRARRGGRAANEVKRSLKWP